jgi:hypothetical protein
MDVTTVCDIDVAEAVTSGFLPPPLLRSLLLIF